MGPHSRGPSARCLLPSDGAAGHSALRPGALVPLPVLKETKPQKYPSGMTRIPSEPRCGWGRPGNHSRGVHTTTYVGISDAVTGVGGEEATPCRVSYTDLRASVRSAMSVGERLPPAQPPPCGDGFITLMVSSLLSAAESVFTRRAAAALRLALTVGASKLAKPPSALFPP